MRMYSGRLIKRHIERQVSQRRELRDAIVWDVFPDDRYCRVKIQGSETLIKAHYNENFESTPQWLKTGNAVRIAHPGGNKGRIEVVGHGFLIPTPIAGGVASPTEPTPGDNILSGLVLFAGGEDMTVSVSTGTFRIDGTEYELGGLTMDNSTSVMDSPVTELDNAGAVVELDAASATLFRIDLIVIGEDSIVDVVKGTEVASEPSKPAEPADHIELGWVLLYPGMTVVANSDLNKMYKESTVSYLDLYGYDDDLAYDDLSTPIYVRVKDQYGITLSESITVTAEIASGDGVQSGDGTITQGAQSSEDSLTVTFPSGSGRFDYHRTAEDAGSSPLLLFTEENTGLEAGLFIILRDSAGEELF